MAFNSTRFLTFLAVVILAYNAVPPRFRGPLLLLASYVFYAESSLSNIGLLLGVTAVAYLGARHLAGNHSLGIAAVFVAAALAPLVVAKYGAFVAGVGGGLFDDAPASVASAIVPVGISFYTFRAVSYIVDVYRGTWPAENNPTKVALHLAWFPLILAGPIERAPRLLPQLMAFARTSARDAYIATKYLLWGFFCKLVVADNAALLADRVLGSPAEHSGSSLGVASLLYSFQMYFDFLGYTTIAIGVARLFGVKLHHNFDRPYCASSLRDFWRRWHITLSLWFRDYLYVPLGGSATKGLWRVGQVMGVFMLSGLWHGAALNFVAWGGVHGAAYLIEEQARRVTRNWPQRGGVPLVRLAKVAMTFSFVTVAWLLFRFNDFGDIQLVLAKVFMLDRSVPYGSTSAALTQRDAFVLGVALTTAVLLDSSGRIRTTLESVPRTRRQIGAELAQVNWLALMLVLLGDRGTRDFIYFRF